MKLVPGKTYTRHQLAKGFDFEPGYMSRAGGMISRPRHNVLLLITHAGGARPNEYDDYPDGEDLVYTGRGKRGDQKREGQNRDLGDNLRDTYVFEPEGSQELRLLGQVECVEEWSEWAEDVDGKGRSILRFRLHFKSGGLRAKGAPRKRPRANGAPNEIRDEQPRPFDPSQPPALPSPPGAKANPEETQALHEKAVGGHHDLLCQLSAWLDDNGWTEVAEMRRAFDLWAIRPRDGARVIFEAKTVRAGSEGPRVRSAIAQLFEYRFFHGAKEDQLCLVCDRPISSRRAKLLDGLGIALIWWDGSSFQAGTGATIW